MKEHRLSIPPLTVAAQLKAADPSHSVWVDANAGSGKTFVLTRRVLRLLLAGVRPEEILCLTYTKAAAAEMRKRVADELGKWAVLDGEALRARLSETTGSAPEAVQLQRARTLFAHALETPGGLKIVTIHAFCESVLHRFPVEAGVPFDFTVIEDHDRERLVLNAREAVLAGGLRGERATAAVTTLFELLSDTQITSAIDAALAAGRKLRTVLSDPLAAKRALRRLTGHPATESRASVLAEVEAGSLFPRARWPELFAHRPPKQGKTKNLNLSERLYRLHGRAPEPTALFQAFLTEGEPRQNRCTDGIRDEALATAIGAEHDRLAELCRRYRRALLVERSEALLEVLAAISTTYEAAKRARSLLDFDDLVEAFIGLIRDRPQSMWVRYKLDSGITHILVDESQDTNPEQWQAVRLLAEEFFEGDGAVTKPRSLFAVGDGKQSIYSFQGANPLLFGESGHYFAARAEASKKPFSRVWLRTSFRTLPRILEAVDKVFADPVLHRAVLADAPVVHDTVRGDEGGKVTLWPPIQVPKEETAGNAWPIEVRETEASAERQIADRIAGEIGSWLAEGRPLERRGRAVRADDVLILVQRRSTLFDEIIRALIRAKLPTPGADRIAVTAHIAVLDLMALGDVLLNPADDLQLAALLRSPLFDVSEADLMALAQPRAPGARLWEALRRSEIPAARAAHEQLAAWRSRLDFDRPFEFFSQVLYADGGLRRFHARLGLEVDDVLSEFLDLALAHEQTAQPSLQGFLAAMRDRDVKIHRDLSESGGGVRVMTLHGAKGLEAPIVILADAASRPTGQQTHSPVVIRTEPPLLILASSGPDHLPETLTLREADVAVQSQEYWRMLYVGMTRAEDELYVTGPLTPGTSADTQLAGSWYQAIEDALRPHGEPLPTAWGESLVYPRERPSPAPIHAAAPASQAVLQPLTPAPLPPPQRRPIIRPSVAGDRAGPAEVLERRNEAALDPDLARQRGMALHVLLEHLGRVPQGQWRIVALRALAQRFPALVSLHEAIADKAIAILTRPDLAAVFGPNSRAEVPFLVEVKRDDGPALLAGRIDRLVVEAGKVLVIDFKSDAEPALAPEALPPAYATQLGLYALAATQLFPGYRVGAAILWTSLESLLELPAERLEKAVSGFTKR